MRIVIDMQGAQTESRFRGIGRYTMSFAQAVVRNRGEHEIILALSGLFPVTIEPIRAAFDGLLPQENIRVWHAPGPVQEETPGNGSRREVAELIREAFLASLLPDIIHVSSLFEGFVDDGITSIGRFDTATPVSVTQYDLIPLLNPDQYLKRNPSYEQYYLHKVSYLRQASILLAISAFTRQETLSHLHIPEEKIVTISTAAEQHFQPHDMDENEISGIKNKFGIHHAFILYTGGADERKNLPRLIQAYAALPRRLRGDYQLLLAGKMPDGETARFKQIARDAGLKDGELTFTGFISDDELVQLYNLCELYVFPSWHEGFGLPALEAMACGAPVIAANSSSLPEVICLDEALFDPIDVTAISQLIIRTLEDKDFRFQLCAHGLKQAKKFSWNETATRALKSWEAIARRTVTTTDWLTRSLAYDRFVEAVARGVGTKDERCIIALSCCMAHNQSLAIERQLLIDVSELCQRDAATGVQRVVRSYLKWLLVSPPAGFRVEPVYATRENGYHYARNFTLRFLGLDDNLASDAPVRWQRGDIFFGLDMQHHVQLAHAKFYRQLLREGVVVKFLVYDLLPIQLVNLFKDSDAKDLHERWLNMVANMDGAICISKATADAFETWIEATAIPCAPTFRTSWVHIGADLESSKPSRGLPDDAAGILETLRKHPTFLCVSTLEPRKRQQQILDAVELLWQEGMELNLVFVGQQGWKSDNLACRLREHAEQRNHLFWLEGISDEFLEKVYAESTCLIAASLNEGFGLSLIEAARYDVPIIARDIPVFREVAGEYAYYFEGEAAADLAEALKMWLGKYNRQQHPTSTGMTWSTWQQSTERLKAALVEQNCPRRQLLVDISELARHDAQTGIQRVVRSILKEWLLNPPEGYRVEPVHATVEEGYRYARQFTQRFLGKNADALEDEMIDYGAGDVFFALDLQPQVQVAHRTFYQLLRREGVEVHFMIYDLLCVLMPQYFPEGADSVFRDWLEVVTESSGAVCISESVANELFEWNAKSRVNCQRPLNIWWFHLGVDLANSYVTKSSPLDTETILPDLQVRPSFIMVGTIEPRKGHGQVLDTFEQLWSAGVDANLVLVGKQGWMVEKFICRVRIHPELNQRLFWLGAISDEYLEKIYANCSCLIAASYGEGFGLPLIEAAQHKLPIIARDIPVFHEVAGGHAYYFSASTPDGLAQAIHEWLVLYKNDRYPKSDNVSWLTWKESAQQLLHQFLRSE